MYFRLSGDIFPRHENLITLTFRPFLATFFIFEKVAKIGKKVRIYIALTFRPFQPLFSFLKKWPKLAKSKAIALTFRPFSATFFIFQKVAKIGKKSKAIIIIIINLFKCMTYLQVLLEW